MLMQQLDIRKIPALQPASDPTQRLHVAIISDGNGRWATSRGLPRSTGHRAGAEAARRVIEAAPAPPQVEDRSAVPRSTEEFVFVRRNGTVFFAVAYAWENGTLRYVTSEGLRRSAARETLDLNATQQFNEQRGLNFRWPA